MGRMAWGIAGEAQVLNKSSCITEHYPLASQVSLRRGGCPPGGPQGCMAEGKTISQPPAGGPTDFTSLNPCSPVESIQLQLQEVGTGLERGRHGPADAESQAF